MNEPSGAKVESMGANASVFNLWLILWLSGFSCLVYQVLWMRQLGLMLGNTSQAAALTLAMFFAGLASGSWYWGQRSARMLRPLRGYAWLECGIALCGLWIVSAPFVMEHWYPLFTRRYGDSAFWWCFPFLWTWLMVFCPAMLMGGTLPVLGHATVIRGSQFGNIAVQLYAINTLGSACGAFATAFFLIELWGVRVTCLIAMSASALAAFLAFHVSSSAALVGFGKNSSPKPSPENLQEKLIPRWWILMLSFTSGLVLLALEIIWSRMLAQVHENSIYSFSATLIVVLFCIAAGAGLASRLARTSIDPIRALIWLIVSGCTSLLLLPFVYSKLTDRGAMLATNGSFASYVAVLLLTTILTIGPSCLLLGSIFPMLMKCEEQYSNCAGESLGHLTAANTIGAIFGSFLAGFVLLEYCGVWRSMQGMALVYLLLACMLPVKNSSSSIAGKLAALAMMFVGLIILTPSRVPLRAGLDHWGRPEVLLEKWEASDATVTVTQDSQQHVSIKINGNYSLGSTNAYVSQVQQARLPLLAFPKTKRLFFLGMGTGVTAGAALDREQFPEVEKVVACELSPAVAMASQKYFAGGAGEPDITNGLFRDPRAQVIIADGRHRLMTSQERYHMINADLFLPYLRGAGNLYSRDHFRKVRSRLMPGGVFVQWLPLYQMTENEFGIITRTMLDVFPQVSLWRGNFQPGAEIAALVGHMDNQPLSASAGDVSAAKQNAVAGATHRDIHQLLLPVNQETALLFYAGNVTGSAEDFRHYPLNTDDRPVIEFGLPKSLHCAPHEGAPQMVQQRFAALVHRLQQRTPPETDPLLSGHTRESRRLPLAGSAFHRASIACILDEEARWKEEWEAFLRHWLNQAE
ncbi:MAG: fused MFS/spermidine synthase [Akkermansiaceae bacterium]